MRRIVFIVLLTLFLISGCVQQPITSKKQEASVEGPKEIQEETKETCTVGWKCVDKNRKGYQFSNCVFTQVNVCNYGCKDGECLAAPAQEEGEGKTFTLTTGIDTMKESGWKSCDFSEGQIFKDGVTDQDFKIELYPTVSGYNHFRVESPISGVWTINKGVADATRLDCMKQIADAATHNNLRSWQTLCIQTKEKDIALVGGYWDGVPAEDTKLTWKYYS